MNIFISIVTCQGKSSQLATGTPNQPRRAAGHDTAQASSPWSSCPAMRSKNKNRPTRTSCWRPRRKRTKWSLEAATLITYYTMMIRQTWIAESNSERASTATTWISTATPPSRSRATCQLTQGAHQPGSQSSTTPSSTSSLHWVSRGSPSSTNSITLRS